MGAENACSFQSLGYYLSTQSNYFVQDATCREPSAEDNSDTIVNFVVYCGQTTEVLSTAMMSNTDELPVQLDSPTST